MRIGVFVYLLLVTESYGWAVAVLMISGASDWADGKIARLLDQSSRLGELLDPAVDRLYMIVVPVTFAVAGIIPWWVIVLLLARDGILAATLPLLRSRGLTALPVTYIGKAATFALLYAFPLVLLGSGDAPWQEVAKAIGWACVIWGSGLYWWSGLLYLGQGIEVIRRFPLPGRDGQSTLSGTGGG